MNKLYLLLEDKIRSLLRFSPRISAEIFLGRKFLVSRGTIRRIADYDDAWIFSCAAHAECIFDVGSNVGFEALVAALLPGVKEVVLIEANPEALNLAFGNLIRNGIAAKARFVPAFAGEKNDQKVKLWTIASGSAGSCYAGHAVTAAKSKSFMEVTTISLDYLEEVYGRTPDFVKIDVEGAERQVLLGSKKLAAKLKTRFLVEMHSNPELSMEENAQSILDWCKNLGYKAWYLAQGIELISSNQVKGRGRCHLLLQPKTWVYPEWLKDIPQSTSLEVCANRYSF